MGNGSKPVKPRGLRFRNPNPIVPPILYIEKMEEIVIQKLRAYSDVFTRVTGIHIPIHIIYVYR